MTHLLSSCRPQFAPRRAWAVFLALCLVCLPVLAQLSPKREFRGVWLHTLNGDYQGMDEARFRSYLCGQLDLFQRAGINAVLFQVRPEADALYRSSYEPWSRFLTGEQGKDPGFDPMAICIEECHRRFMEFHAWINPYRAQLNRSTRLSPSHPYYAHPEWFFEYDNKLFFNPGLPECRAYILQVVRDIVSRYDVDGLHVDDYFYPYPAGGQPVPDEATYRRYGEPRGMTLGDWRRYNVNMLVQELQETVHREKPYVKFGISPFGIYRNRRSAGEGFGSETNGLQNYDDLYADVLLWLRYGWVDYVIPQLYWEMGHRAADYETLVRWWPSCSYGRLLFIGQDVDRCAKHASLTDPSTNQFREKAAFTRFLPGISGNCYWSGKVLLQNPGNIYTVLEREFQRFPALPPVYPVESEPVEEEGAKAARKRARTSEPPKANPVRKLKAMWTEDGYILLWRAPKVKEPADEPRFYVIYRFGEDEPVDLENPTRIVGYSSSVYYKLPYEDGTRPYRYVVTSVNRYNAESKAKSKKVKL